MGGSLDLMGSYIVGGVVLILMTGVIINFQEGAQETVLQEISQLSMAQMSQTMDKEINNMGYRVNDEQKVLALDYRSITFLSDFNNDGIVDTISYSMEKSQSGPVIRRRIATPGERPLTWTSRGSMVLFSGFDSTGTPTTDPARIRGIEASMLTSNVLYEKLPKLTSASTLAAVDGSNTQLTVTHDALLRTAVDCQAGAYWHKVMYPQNLSTVPPQIADKTLDNLGSGTTTGGTDDPGDTGGTTDPGDTGGATDPGDTGGTTDPGDTGGATDPGDTGGGTTIDPPSNDPCDPPPGANDPCCCGSGAKYKNCCGRIK